MELTSPQVYFIKCACDLNNVIIDFDMEDKEFEDTTGFTKAEMYKEIKDLREKMK